MSLFTTILFTSTIILVDLWSKIYTLHSDVTPNILIINQPLCWNYWNNSTYINTLSFQNWDLLHFSILDKINSSNDITPNTQYSFFNFNNKLGTFTPNFNILYVIEISENQLQYDKQILQSYKNKWTRGFMYNPILGDEIFYNFNTYGPYIYYILNNIHTYYPIIDKTDLNLYSFWYISKYPISGGNEEATTTLSFIDYVENLTT